MSVNAATANSMEFAGDPESNTSSMFNQIRQVEQQEVRPTNYSNSTAYMKTQNKLAQPQKFLEKIPDSRDTFLTDGPTAPIGI